MVKGFPKGKTRKQASRDRDGRALVAVKMHTMGSSYREIADELDISRTSAFELVKRETDKATKELDDAGRNMVTTQIARLEHVTKLALRDIEKSIEIDFEPGEDGRSERVIKQIEKIDPQVAQVIFKAQERMSKYLGHDTPQKVEHEHKLTLADLIMESKKQIPMDAEFKEDE